MSCSRQNSVSSGTRAMVPSSFMISQITPAGTSPARRARSTEASVCPARTSTPPLRARSGKMCPGRARSLGRVAGIDGDLDGVRAIVGRDAGGDAVPGVDRFGEGGAEVRGVLGRHLAADAGSRSRSSVMARQISPRPYLAMKLMASGVIFSAAMVRSPSFSRSSSSMTTIMRPARISSSAVSTSQKGLGVDMLVSQILAGKEELTTETQRHRESGGINPRESGASNQRSAPSIQPTTDN